MLANEFHFIRILLQPQEITSSILFREKNYLEIFVDKVSAKQSPKIYLC